MPVFSLSKVLLGCLAVLCSGPAGAFTLVPGPILLGTTEEVQEVLPSGTAELQAAFPDFLLTLAGEVSIGTVIVHPDETGIGGLHATFSAGPTPLQFGAGGFSATLENLVLTLDGGFASCIFCAGHDFATDPVAALLPSLPLFLPYDDYSAGTLSFSIPLDLTIPVSGMSAPLVIEGTLVFSQVPEPGLAALFGVAALAARRLRRG